MFLSRIVTILFVLSLLSSCTIPFFKEKNISNNSSYNELQQVNSGFNNNNASAYPNMPIISIPNLIPDNTIIKTESGISVNNTKESDKDNCLKNFNSPVDQQNCIDTIYIKKALAAKDASLCSVVVNPSSQQNCTDNIVLQQITTKNDAALCKGLKNPEAIGNCIAIVGKQNQSQNTINKGNITDICMGIQESEVESACRESAIFNEAVQKRDTKMCETLVREDKKNDCMSLIRFILEKGNAVK